MGVDGVDLEGIVNRGNRVCRSNGDERATLAHAAFKKNSANSI
jgi:hypothetical protein